MRTSWRMTMILYDFRCPNGHVFEDFVVKDTLTVRCNCGAQATRIISTVNFKLPGHDDAYPTAHSRWVREHEEAGRKTPQS